MTASFPLRPGTPEGGYVVAEPMTMHPAADPWRPALDPGFPGPYDDARPEPEPEPEQQAALRAWCAEVGQQLGRLVAPAEVMDALVRRLLVDDTLAAQLRTDLGPRPH